MQAVLDDADWHLRAVTTGEVVKTVRGPRPHAPDLRGDVGVRRPGHAVRHDDQPLAHRGQHRPHQREQPVLASTCTSTTRRATWRASTCCSSSTTTTVRRRGRSRPRSRSCSPRRRSSSAAPTTPPRRSPRTRRRFRQLGLGYANLGALLMALGLPYDSDAGRAWAAAITALMTGHAYATSARTAARMGPFAGFAENREHMLARARHAPRGRGHDRRRARARPSCWRRAALVGRRLRPRRRLPASATRRPACSRRQDVSSAASLVATERGLVRLDSLGDPDRRRSGSRSASRCSPTRARAARRRSTSTASSTSSTSRRPAAIASRAPRSTGSRSSTTRSRGSGVASPTSRPGDLVPLALNQLVGEPAG